MPKAKTADTPIVKNEQVQELLAILSKRDMPSAQDFLAVVNHIDTMEKQLAVAVDALADMRQELAEAQKQNHSVKTAMQKAIVAMQGQVLDLRDKLAELKQNVIDGCKTAVAAFKEKGIVALDNVAQFFKIRPILENMRDNLDKNIRFDDKAIAKIEAISTEYHDAGLHIKNMGRAVLGKEAAQEAKAPGKLAAVISYPFHAERSHFAAMKKRVEATIGRLTRLEERAAEKKPSIKEALAAHTEQIAQAQKAAPAPERPRPAER